MNAIRKDLKVDLFLIGNGGWEIRDQQGNVLKDCGDDYFIYLKDVVLKKGTMIPGKYCGELNENSSILDEYCKDVITDGKRFIVDGKLLTRARMLAVNNKTKLIQIL